MEKETKAEKILDIVEEDSRSADKPLKKILFNNFLGGIAWTLGVTTGATLVIAILSYILGKVNLIPIVGSFVLGILEFVQKNNPNL